MRNKEKTKSLQSVNYWEYIYSKLFTLFDTDDNILDKDIASLMRKKESRENYLRAVESLRDHERVNSKERTEGNRNEEEVKLDQGEITITLS